MVGNEFIQLLPLYVNAWPTDGLEIETSVRSLNFVTVTVPPAPPPILFLNNPEFSILVDSVFVKSVEFSLVIT